MKIQIISIFALLLLNVALYAKGYDIVVSQDGKGNCKTIQQAINAVPDNSTKRTFIFVKKGIYKEKVIVPSSKINVSLIGEDVNKTIITWNDYNPRLVGPDTINTWTSFTFAVDAEGFYAENMTFENSAGQVGQAVAVRIISDKVIFKNCRFRGNQDTLFAHGVGRMYFVDCYIEGTTDFIFGSAIALFENCHIHSKKNSYITAASTPMGNQYGYVFKKCELTADSGVNKVFLGRPWRPYAKTVFIECLLGRHILPEGWDNWRNPANEKTVFYAEYKNTGAGADTSLRAPWSSQLPDSVLAKYSPEMIFARNSLSIPVVGSWNPLEFLNAKEK